MKSSASSKLLKRTNLPLTSLECGAVLQQLTNTKSLKQGQQLHAHIITSNTLAHNTYLSTKLAAFYANCTNCMHEAQLIFETIERKSSFLWNSIIRGYVNNGSPFKALNLYRGMVGCGVVRDKFTYPFAVKACRELGGIWVAKMVHGEVVVNGYASDLYVMNCLLSMYLKFGDMGCARTVFDGMRVRDLTSWNTMISGCVKNGEFENAFEVFMDMREFDDVTLLGVVSACAGVQGLREGKAVHGYYMRRRGELCNEFLRNSVIEMYCCCGSMDYAGRLFEGVRGKDIVMWNSMVLGYARNGGGFEGLRMFCRLVLEGWNPDQVTFIAVLEGCVHVSALQFGMSVHACVMKSGFGWSIEVGTAVVDMYSKCGSLDCSRRAFDELPEKNLMSWGAMITGYGAHGKGEDAICVFNEMIKENICPDEGLFVTLLSACSHAGLVNEGKEIFYQMIKEYKIKPTHSHYSCLVDLLGRAGHLSEAYKLIQNMDVRPTIDIWAALLSACRPHRNVNLAEIAAQEIFSMSPKGVGSYICLSNIYAAEKRWDDVERVRVLLREKGLKKPAGCSFVEVDKVVHRFMVGDRSHQQKEDIYDMLDNLKHRLKEAGYEPDTSSVFYDVEENVKEKILWEHSERLAIAFALINTAPGSIIRITKNLRVCGDCHTVTKFISSLLRREIIMRDIRRFHHFKDGVCSCGDYW